MREIFLRIFAVVFLLSGSTLMAAPTFEIKLPCPDSKSPANNLGKVVRFYSSMQAFSNDKPRCILNEALIASDQVIEAKLHNDVNTNDIIVDIIFSDSGREKLREFTTQHVGQPIALMVEGKILTIPTIQAPIDQGFMQIHGLWYEDAVRLARSINQPTK